ncbi:YlbF/YmcA family competence regulator [Streptococcus castoreus]|uniref:YlbF/YmcA family competence regulator n=1 Tax=Streptococcus castoreus TaxID=254786 RepID=UPI0003F8CA6E|nr:YlbF/YmcA family competence regulator [Streptococcus castoreus]
MSQEIYDNANKLERALRALPEYQKVLEVKEAIKIDPTASQLFDEFIAMQEKIQGMMQTGQMPTAEEQSTIQDLSQKMEANDQLKTYFEAQQALSIYVSDIERIVFAPLKDLVN